MDDDHLIADIKLGNERAFKSLFEKYYRPLCAYLRSYTPDFDSAEELAQTTFVKFWNKREEIDVHTSVKSYLFKMGYNSFLKTIRQKNKQSTLLEELKYKALEEEENRPENDLQAATERLRNIIETLPPRCQEILKLKLEGLKYQEIADQLNLSIKTVEAQMRIAFTKIREDFKDGLILWILLNTRKV
ncbi:RNA polymerase sigma-70 factor, Bacteroides expansion family 1 [Aequorivita sublithincola DSM 14238]|uniref:RNA polymerase sigma factor SigS n=1 Tax=Aequorivita sublithincola (strain DSM 14238 / LMG 21431 / ACAM 643 / 9-3) TaxID=746697 RepID=I3YRL7_AEQSU|nr:RNA polymerase sigma-70 factor [Aequorivita sublithincola]AFL79635.1 RNA polymerase sigma-70 factor, Bacteroides expansion family 1 [Aequorivita sublithincola DSM 14238]